MSPEQAYKALIVKADDKTEAQFYEVYDGLKPVEPDFLIGHWKGGALNIPFNNEHPTHKQLGVIKWAGKNFQSAEDVNPIIVYDDDGKRKVDESWGEARLRKLDFRGVVSTAMIYDKLAIIDSFRYVDDNLLAGIMDCRGLAPYHFYLERLTPKN